jgi:hypothetical protein
MENNLPPSKCKHFSSEEHFPYDVKRSAPLFYPSYHKKIKKEQDICRLVLEGFRQILLMARNQ